jgi:circadian clock protein KaiB
MSSRDRPHPHRPRVRARSGVRATDTPEPEYLFRLFVSGLTPRSQGAIEHLREYCKRHLDGRYRIEVVDLYQSPELAAKEQIVATPTLVQILPTPQRRLIGDLSNEGRFLRGLEIRSSTV